MRSSMSVPVRAGAVMVCGSVEMSPVAKFGSVLSVSARMLSGSADMGQGYGAQKRGRRGDGDSSRPTTDPEEWGFDLQ